MSYICYFLPVNNDLLLHKQFLQFTDSRHVYSDEEDSNFLTLGPGFEFSDA